MPGLIPDCSDAMDGDIFDGKRCLGYRYGLNLLVTQCNSVTQLSDNDIGRWLQSILANIEEGKVVTFRVIQYWRYDARRNGL